MLGLLLKAYLEMAGMDLREGSQCRGSWSCRHLPQAPCICPYRYGFPGWCVSPCPQPFKVQRPLTWLHLTSLNVSLHERLASLAHSRDSINLRHLMMGAALGIATLGLGFSGLQKETICLYHQMGPSPQGTFAPAGEPTTLFLPSKITSSQQFKLLTDVLVRAQNI